MPDVDAIVSGVKVDVPQSIDLQYALASSLVGQAVRIAQTADSETKLGNILDYAASFPEREMGVMLVSDMHRAIGDPLFKLPQFKGWANQVYDVLIFDDEDS